jgi:hypothetical protein
MEKWCAAATVPCARLKKEKNQVVELNFDPAVAHFALYLSLFFFIYFYIAGVQRNGLVFLN